MSVNLAADRAALEYDPGKVKLSEIKQAIVKAGYTPKDIEQKGLDEESEKRLRALKNMRSRLIVAIIFAAPILYLAMALSSVSVVSNALRLKRFKVQ